MEGREGKGKRELLNVSYLVPDSNFQTVSVDIASLLSGSHLHQVAPPNATVWA